jgi:predicted esterase
LVVHANKRLIDPTAGRLGIHFLPAYAAGEAPAGAVLRLTVLTSNGMTLGVTTDVPVPKLPANATIAIDKLPAGDHMLRVNVVIGEKVLARYVTGISVAPNLGERIDRLEAVASKIATTFNAKSTDAKTLETLSGLVKSLHYRASPETNYPAARLLTEAELLLKAVQAGEKFYCPQRTGQFWLTLPTAFKDSDVRLFVPEAAQAGKPMPLVVALHGAGGSENLFFDAYGYGLIARLAQDRGWMVVAPRAGWLFDAAPPVPAIVDELAKLYPVNKQRIYVVGHSMGAMHAVTLAQEGDPRAGTPGRYAAIAALGGGGAVTKPEAFKDLPVFIGCGSEDFLLVGANGLEKSLEKSGARRVTYKEYPGVEHMLVVQESLPEVFKFFEKTVSDASEKRSESASPKRR